MPDLVSILIPAYNAEEWIADTIRSALAQTWPNKEIIVVDDGSRDETLKIARHFESKSLTVISQENRGASAARNRALEYAQGDYIQWLDSDDLLAPDKISKQLQLTDSGRDSTTLLSAAYGTFYFRPQKANFQSNSLFQDLNSADWIFIKFMEHTWLADAVWLVSRKLTDLAGPWDVRLSLDDDGEYFTRLVSISEKVQFVPDARVYYRVGHSGSLSSGKSAKALSSLFLSTCLCIEHLLSLEDSERTRLACVKYLQDALFYFYPERVDIVSKARDLARSLGGNLLPPSESFAFRLIRTLVGWNIAKTLKYTSHKATVMAERSWDKLFYARAGNV